MAGYVHWIDLYDENNTRVDPVENPRPYSPEKTCGRCHDFKSIAHGWHFNAASDQSSAPGRPGLPMIWSDARTGTHLPLSYRGWKGTHTPQQLGISHWQMAAKFGGYLPGMASPLANPKSENPTNADVASESPVTASVDRSRITGNLPIDCMLCHFRPGSGYSSFAWTEQIQEQNFSYAPTAALGIGVVTGNLKRLKDDLDLSSAEAIEQLPTIKYEPNRFRSDGKVFIDLIRKPSNESCYYCHTNMPSDGPKGDRWMHDDDVHLRAGLSCADCHRNGIDHETVRGFEGEQHKHGSITATLSCQGCHLGNQADLTAGRMGAPRPAHLGLPPLHFEKLSCTACHSGPALNSEIERVLTSTSHQLGSHIKRTGQELPAIFSNVILPVSGDAPLDEESAGSRFTPHRLMYPSFWGYIRDGKLQPINPEKAFELIRRPLKIRKDFTEEIGEVKLTLSQRKQILGDDKLARLKPEELNDQQRDLIQRAETTERKKQIDERLSAALKEIESAYSGTQPVFVSGGAGVSLTSEGNLKELSLAELGEAAQPYGWPTAHTVRPAQQSLGVNGCTECHGENANFFYAALTPISVLPGQEIQPVPVHQLQHVDIVRLSQWSKMFAGRSIFKVVSLALFGLTATILVAAVAVNLSSTWRSNDRRR